MKIALLARNPHLYSHRRICEAARARGHDIEVLNTLRVSINITSRRPMLFYRKRRLEDFDAVIPRIGASITFYGLAVLRQFEVMGVYPLNESVAIGRSRDKLRCFQLLEGTQGIGVVLGETVKSAKSVIEAFHGANVNILVQQFIKEAEAMDIRLLVIGDRVVAAMKRQGPAGEFRSNLHRGGLGDKVRITPQERSAAVRAARTLGLNVCGVDLLRSKNGPLVLEVNSSPGIEGLEKATGIDVATPIIEFLERHAAPN